MAFLSLLPVLFLAIAVYAAAPALADEGMCVQMTTTRVVIPNIELPSCLEFYRTGPAIRVPKDTATVKYGILGDSQFSPTSAFLDRYGNYWPANKSLAPATTNPQLTSQLIVQATFDNTTIASIVPILFVSKTAMVKVFHDTSFIGTVANWDPPTNVNDTNWFRWDFGSTIKWQDRMIVLEGAIINLYKAVRDSSGKCRNALCSPKFPHSARCKWYQSFVKNASMSIQWNPAMHAPMDSEFVSMFSTGISYMDSAPTPNALLAGNVNMTKPYSFKIHGSPMNTVFEWAGTFSKLEAPCYCG